MKKLIKKSVAFAVAVVMVFMSMSLLSATVRADDFVLIPWVIEDDDIFTAEQSSQPYLRILTEFPTGTVLLPFVDIEYIATPTSGAFITEVFYSINGRFHRYIYHSGNATLGQARVFITPGINNIEFTARDSFGFEATYVVQNAPFFQESEFAPPPEHENLILSFRYPGEIVVNNRLFMRAVSPINNEAIESTINSIGGVILGNIGFTGLFTIQVSPASEERLHELAEYILEKYPHLFISARPVFYGSYVTDGVELCCCDVYYEILLSSLLGLTHQEYLALSWQEVYDFVKLLAESTVSEPYLEIFDNTYLGNHGLETVGYVNGGDSDSFQDSFEEYELLPVQELAHSDTLPPTPTNSEVTLPVIGGLMLLVCLIFGLGMKIMKRHTKQETEKPLN
jgi:hypothetical protein